MILSTTLSERFMLPCSLLIYEIKLGKQTIASLSSDKERSKLLKNWAQGVYSLEKQDSESLSDDTDDSEEDKFQELSLGKSENDDNDTRSHSKTRKGKTKRSDIRPGSQRGAVRWTTAADKDSFQAQAGSNNEEYVEPEAITLKVSHAGASASSILSPIKETAERLEPPLRGVSETRSAEKRAPSSTEGHTPSTTERHEHSTAERRGTRSAEKRAPNIAEKHAPSTTERHESSTQKEVFPTSTARIASSKPVKPTCDQTAPSSPRASSTDAKKATLTAEKITASAAPRA
eukprot:6187374-Pleurochrysis_carterae.AAC.1